MEQKATLSSVNKLYEIRLGGLTKDLKTDKIYYIEVDKNGRKNRD